MEINKKFDPINLENFYDDKNEPWSQTIDYLIQS